MKVSVEQSQHKHEAAIINLFFRKIQDKSVVNAVFGRDFDKPHGYERNSSWDNSQK